jgi:hypothetical protein
MWWSLLISFGPYIFVAIIVFTLLNAGDISDKVETSISTIKSLRR